MANESNKAGPGVDGARADRAGPNDADGAAQAELGRVLVASDSPGALVQPEHWLAPWPVVAADAQAIVAAIGAERPDIIVLDLALPAAVVPLLRAVRAVDPVAAIPLIVLAAEAGDAARAEALAAGADDYLARPFSARELAALVRSQVTLARTRRAAGERLAGLLSELAEVRGDLASIMDGAGDAFLNVDADLRIVAVKKSDPPMVALPAEQLIGQVLTEVAPEFGPVAAALRRAMGEHRAVNLNFLHTPSNRWFSVRCYPGGGGAIAFGNEITRRKTAEARLKQANAELEMRVLQRTRDLNTANALLEAVFERSPAGIVMADFEGRIVRANAAFERLVGLSGAQLRALTIEHLSEPSDAALNQVLLEKLRAGEADTFLTETRFRRPDGGVSWVENFVGTIDGEDGRPRYLVKIVQDISSRKAAADEILASRNELRFLYDWLQHVRKDERIALAREVHDQLGQILSAAKIDIKLLLEDVQSSSAGLPRRKLVQELSSASDTLDQAIDSARSIAMQLRPPEIDSQGLYAAVDWHARDFERRTRVRVELDLPAATGGPTCAGAAALFRILQEGLTNILRHARATCVAISVQRRGHRILLRVRDNGIGIAQARVRQSGTLGLVGMRERAVLVGGRVAIRRLAAGGTLLSALLPVSEFRHP
ncbi:PAS domain S-box protein [Massilia soli]|nr:PAS domain S-box protein [Massilia soli]